MSKYEIIVRVNVASERIYEVCFREYGESNCGNYMMTRKIVVIKSFDIQQEAFQFAKDRIKMLDSHEEVFSQEQIEKWECFIYQD